ncbi:hypothetical protein PoB_003322500 [Plakobranchus ocellatus]|uniref:Uncharacterized protein n=1 Tax=Plakobranchus ocellatus TaxID=259542 RepID=A0AAV4AIS8_9GAST|nr:hypothetical protein PoB_003322500 [Plakobranchus ocellatus]
MEERKHEEENIALFIDYMEYLTSIHNQLISEILVLIWLSSCAGLEPSPQRSTVCSSSITDPGRKASWRVGIVKLVFSSIGKVRRCSVSFYIYWKSLAVEIPVSLASVLHIAYYPGPVKMQFATGAPA